MARRSLHRYALTALLVPLALIVGLRSAWALYACRVDGGVRTSCCCHGKHEQKQPPSNEPHVAATSCCDISVQAPSSAPQMRDADRTSMSAPPVTTIDAAIAPVPAPRARVAVIDRSNARPPPIATYLLKQSFLR